MLKFEKVYEYFDHAGITSSKKSRNKGLLEASIHKHLENNPSISFRDLSDKISVLEIGIE